jgi:hypothetical protein
MLLSCAIGSAEEGCNANKYTHVSSKDRVEESFTYTPSQNLQQ